MKIILHGATNGSNFGDYLFADIFYRKLSECNRNGETLFFEFPRYGIGKFYRKELHYSHRQSVSDLLYADLLVYISGGYFGDQGRSTAGSMKRFIRYMLIGIYFVLRKKNILMLGVGGGPVSNGILRKTICMLMERSLTITVRDEETAKYFRNYGVKKDILVTSDTAQSITRDMLPELEEAIKAELDTMFMNKKIVFLHVHGSHDADSRIVGTIIGPLNEFLMSHKEYGVIVSCDYARSSYPSFENINRALQSHTVYYYRYNHPWQLCSLLDRADLIITTKLHVGIVGATLSKSVIAFPMHAEKTLRYFNQIGEPERAIPIGEATYAIVSNMFNKFYDKRISLPEKIVRDANYNISILEETVKAIIGEVAG